MANCAPCEPEQPFPTTRAESEFLFCCYSNPNNKRSVTALTATSIADAYHRFIFPKLSHRDRKQLQIILGGGGAKNPVLRNLLETFFGGQIFTHEDFGIANEAKEALAFAIMAYETVLGRPSNVPSGTGARRSVVLGKIVPGEGAF